MPKNSDQFNLLTNAERTDLFSAILDIAHDAIIGINQSQNIVLFNQGAIRIFGYDPDEVMSRPLDILLPPALAEIHRAHVHEFGESTNTSRTMAERREISGRRKDGTIFPAEANIAKASAGGQTIFTVTLRDITSRKLAVQKTQRLYDLLNRTGQMAKVGGWEFDPKTLQGTWTDEVARIHEMDPQNPTSAEIGLNFYTGESKTKITQAIQHATQNAEGYDLVLEMITAKGIRKWVHTIGMPVIENGEVVRIEGSFQDITEFKQAEEQVNLQKERAESLTRVAACLNTKLDLQSVLKVVCEETAQALNVPIVIVILLDEMRDVFYNAASAGLSSEFADAFVPSPYVLAEAPSRENHDTIVVTDMQTLPDQNPNIEIIRRLNLRTRVGALLYYQDRLAGELNIITTGETRLFNNVELTLLRALADQAVQAIVNAQLFERTQQHLLNVEAMRSIDMAIANSFDLRLTLNEVIAGVITQLGVDAAEILLFKPVNNMLEFAAGQGFRTNTMQKGKLRLGDGIAGRVALERRRIHVPNLAEVKDNFTRAPLFIGEGFLTYYGVPLLAKGLIKGVLEIFHRTPLNFDDERLNFLETLAGQAAIAIDSTQAFEELQRANLQLSQAYDATIEGWSRAMDLRDKETEGHTQRVTEFTVRLAEAAGMSQEEIIHVRRGALLHDMGKLGVPDNILLKQGKLTDEEWVIMRQHPQFAYDMLSSIKYLHSALDIPYCHHEKWDGTGYPRKLKGEQIPLAARLFAVVDVWDALRSDRPYRQGWPEEKVYEYIRTQVGTHFDPKAVDVFFKVMSEEKHDAS
jgi:PAS domain S-box-containing protein